MLIRMSRDAAADLDSRRRVLVGIIGASIEVTADGSAPLPWGDLVDVTADYIAIKPDDLDVYTVPLAAIAEVRYL